MIIVNRNKNLNIPPINSAASDGQAFQHQRSRASSGPVPRIPEINTGSQFSPSPTPHLQGSSWQSNQNGGSGMGGSSKPKKKKKKGPWRIVFWLAIILLVTSLVGLGVIAYSYWEGQKGYRDLAVETVGDLSGKTLADMKVDWDALRAINPDTVGWVYVPGTVINYPIVRGADNEKYLTVDFSGGQSQITHFGTVFLSAENTADFSDKNNIIYGHNMNDGSMFSAFAGFLNTDEFNSHRTIYLLTPEGNYQLDTFSVFVCSPNDPLAQTEFKNDEDYLAYVQDKINRDEVVPSPAGTPAKDIDRTYVFVTCTSSYEDSRVVLYANAVESTNGSSSSSGGASMINDKAVTDVEEATKEL